MARSRKPGPGQESLFPALQPTSRPARAASASPARTNGGGARAVAPQHAGQMSVEPLLQAHQFLAAHRTYGGATMEAKSGRVFAPGEEGYFVGGHPSAKGSPLSSTMAKAGSWTVDDVMRERERVLSTAADPDTATVGSWDHQGQTHFDASTVFHDRRAAENAGYHRNQIAIWDNAKSEEIPTGGTGNGPKKYPTTNGLNPGSWRDREFNLSGSQYEKNLRDAHADLEARSLSRVGTDSDPKAPASMLMASMRNNIALGR